MIGGTLQRVGDALRITARIVDVATGAVEFGARVDGGIADLFDFQDEVAAVLADRISADPGGTMAVRNAPTGSAPSFAPARRGGGWRWRPGTRRSRPSSPLFLPPRPRGGPRRPGFGPRSPSLGPRSPAAGPEQPVSGTLAFGSAPADGSAPPRDSGQGRGRTGRGGGGFAPTPLGRATAVIGRTNNPPEIDGRLDDSVWETATHITDFVQIAPLEGTPASEETEAWMAYDADHLYFAFYAYYTRPETMRINRADREEIRGDDRMAIYGDPGTEQIVISCGSSCSGLRRG